VMARTSYEWTLLDFAIWFAGGVTVPIYETSSASQVEWIIQDAGVRRVFAGDHATVQLVAGVLAGSDVLRDRLVNVVRMDYDGEAPDLASLAAAGAGVSDTELERQRSHAGLAD
uniref:AMP-binding protein n=1 Tax=Pseudomonas aeruginosa TaxID=287 RepID=UPI003CF247A1